jgi:hypothetical protein
MSKTVNIGCYSAFFGDTTLSARQLVECDERVDYLVADYLAEVTMVILARKQMSDPDGGFIDQFVSVVWKPLMKKIIEKKIKVITNAGGLLRSQCVSLY